MRPKQFLAFILLIFSFSFSYGQNKLSNILSKGSEKVDEIYENSGYMDYVDKTTNEEKLDNKSLAKIANSFRMNSKTAQAEIWYAKFIHQNEDPIHFWHYSQVLQSNGKCEEAISWFKKFKENSEEEGLSQREFVNNCDEIIGDEEAYGVTIKNLEEINTKHLDFSAIPFSGEIIFTSTRKGTVGFASIKDLWTNDNFSDLFISSLSQDGAWGEPKPLLGKVNAKLHDGTATFNRGKNVMYFTRNNAKKKSNAEKVNLKIYVSTFENEAWSNPVELPFNSEKFNTCHPTLSSDEKHLYFSSNRPDGFGGMDLYVSEMVEGKWQEPVNLGSDINSPDNELFPFMKENGTLYFASNGHKGLGGLDIYKVAKNNSATRGNGHSKWTEVVNMGQPFNSPSDDFGFFSNLSNTEGFLSSNREGGKGGDDIYSWKRDEGQMYRTICVFDKNTDQPISEAKITIIETSDQSKTEAKNELLLSLKKVETEANDYQLTLKDELEEQKTTKVVFTDEQGRFKHPIKKDYNYEVKIEKNGFSSFRKSFDFISFLAADDCFSLEERDCSPTVFTVLEKASQAQMPMAFITVVDNSLSTKKKYPLDENGKLNLCIQKDHHYTIEADHVGFLGTSRTLTEEDKTNKEDIVLYVGSPKATPTAVGQAPSYAYNPSEPVRSNVNPSGYVRPNVNPSGYVPPNFNVVSPNNYPNGNSYSPQVNYLADIEKKIDRLHKYFLGSTHSNFEVDQIIELKDIYYDYDKHFIKPDAAYALDNVVDLLILYPSMEISLRSHTDSRGSDTYNDKLSLDRAIQAKEYIISKGIASHRVAYRNYGEQVLRNRCGNGIECSEEEHQMNRRTEIKVTKLDHPNVKVKPH